MSTKQQTFGGEADIPINLDGPLPISRDQLKVLWPEIRALDEIEIQEVSRALNTIPGPCESCGNLPIAHCVAKGQDKNCAVIDKLVKRTLKLVCQKQPIKTVKNSINYPDIWFDFPSRGVPVEVRLYRDTEGSFHQETNQVLTELQAQFGHRVLFTIFEKDDLADDRLGVRSRPTWFINGHRFRGVQSPGTLGRYISLEETDQQR